MTVEDKHEHAGELRPMRWVIMLPIRWLIKKIREVLR